MLDADAARRAARRRWRGCQPSWTRGRGGEAIRPADAAPAARAAARGAGFERLRDQVRRSPALLEEKAGIPMVREQMALILDVQADEWWQDVTIADAGGGARGASAAW